MHRTSTVKQHYRHQHEDRDEKKSKWNRNQKKGIVIMHVISIMAHGNEHLSHSILCRRAFRRCSVIHLRKCRGSEAEQKRPSHHTVLFRILTNEYKY